MSTPTIPKEGSRVRSLWRRSLRWIVFALVSLAVGIALMLGWRYGLTPLLWGAVAGAGLGLALRGVRWMAQAPPLSFLLILLGSILGLALGALLTPALARLPGALGVYLPLGVTLFLGLVVAWGALARQKALVEAFPRLERLARPSRAPSGMALLDSSALIDGRVAGLVEAGFLRETLAVPRFVVDELRRTAEGSDPVQRARGRRGLEVLHRLRKERRVPLQVLEANARGEKTPAARLLTLAQRLKASIITADNALSRLGKEQGAHILNLNDLANALQPVVLAGEVLQVRIIQEGREPGQGVGFLDDGTMVVVEGGQQYINTFVDVVVMRVHQSPAGRVIFAQPKDHRRGG